MYKQYSKGGQRRTIEAGCGYRCQGHPQEVNKKFEIHKRYCNTCKESHTETLPEFNKTAGLMNGWKGINNRNNQPDQHLTTAFVDGERYDILTKANTLEKAMDDVRLTANLIAENIIEAPEPVKLTKSQKKRMKRKGRAAALKKDEDDEDDDITEENIEEFVRKLLNAGNDVAVVDLTNL